MAAAAGDLSDDEKRAIRGSKFAPLPPPPPKSRPQPRMAHPGGPLTTNKAAALAKFLERKLQQPDGLDSLNPDLVKMAVKNAKETIKASNGEPSTSGRVVRHVSSFEDGSEDETAVRLADASIQIPEYRPINVFVNFYSKPEYKFRVDRENFFPRPKVDGAVISFKLKNLA